LHHLAYAAGAQACIPKPFRREALIAIIETVLAQASRQTAEGVNPP
jgi:DNA-binding response OmpR family regulator